MAVQFILGRSGTGKTGCCIEQIVNALLESPLQCRGLNREIDAQPLILLVPEQATYQAERAILNDKRIAGYNRLNVLSFDRLQFLLSGRNTAEPTLSRLGQQMIIHRILRDHKSKLKVFGSSATQPGLGRQMAGAIAELGQYAKTPDDIDRLLNELQKKEHNNLAVLKFADIGLVFKEYLKFIEGRFIDSDIQLRQACRAVVGTGFAKGAKLWVDGFAGFTTVELAILAELLKVTADAQIALCLDPSDIDLTNPDIQTIDPAGLFNPTQQTYTTLVEIVKKCKLQLAEPIILERAVRFSHCPQLGHIEQNIFEFESTKIPTADNVRIVSAPNARAEVRFAARQILRLVKEKDYRYRDIAVIASDIDRYQHYIRAYFDDYRLPFFIDKRKPLSRHPVVQLICSALQIVTGGFSSSDVFAYLKTDLVPIERCDVDLLENYCLAFGIAHSDWIGGKDWHFADKDDRQFDEQRVNQSRLKVSKPLLELRDKLCPPDNPAKTVGADEFTQIVFDFLDSLQVSKKIAGWTEEAGEREDYAAVDEHRQFYKKLVDVFDELGEAFAGQEMSCADWLAIINSAFSQLTLAFIPPNLDQVLVGSIERSRHPNLKAVFLIGATQKQFPVPVGFDSLLTDDDRSAAESADFQLAATTAQRLCQRQYLAYIAFTRPSQLLCITYPATDDKGSAIPRSRFIDNLESLFENLGEESSTDEQIQIDNVHSEKELADLLCSRLGGDSEQDLQFTNCCRLGELLNDIAADEQLAELGSTVVTAIDYDNRAQLDKKDIERLFGRKIKSSATKLSTFAACPYRYFARYILELKERKEFKFEPLDLGAFYHRVLDALLKRVNAEKKDFAAVQDEQLLEILRSQIAEIVREDAFISNFIRRSAHNSFIITSAGETLEDCVRAIAQMVRAGSFKPTLSEVWFGERLTAENAEKESKLKISGNSVGEEKAFRHLGEYKLALPDGRLLSLDGKIDRLDIANIDGEKIAAVFDYKSKAKSFSWSQFYHGLDMQLPIYMLAVRDSNYESRVTSHESRIAGAFYMPVEVSPTAATLSELPGKTRKFNYKAKGIFNGEFFQQLDSSNSNKFYNFFVTKNGDQYGRDNTSGALRPADFEKVLRFTEQKIIQLAEEILSGKIDVKPYHLSGKSPCSYCKYKSLCRFDWQINDYNHLESLNKLQVLDNIGTGDD